MPPPALVNNVRDNILAVKMVNRPFGLDIGLYLFESCVYAVSETVKERATEQVL